MSRRQSHRTQSAINVRLPRLVPSEQPREEASQCDEPLALSNQNDATDPDLGARIENALRTMCAVKLEAVLAAEIANAPPTGISPDEPRVPV